MMIKKYLSMRHKGKFIYALLGVMTSRMATYAFLAAVSFYVLKITGSTVSLSITLLSGTLPIMLIGIISGRLVDRFNRVNIIMITDVVRILAMVIVLIGDRYFHDHIVLVLSLVCAMTSTMDSISAIAYNSLVPAITDKDDLVAVNGLSTTVLEISRVFGPFIGVVIYEYFDFFAVIGWSIVIYTAALFVERVVKDKRVIDTDQSAKKRNPAGYINEYTSLFTSNRRFFSLLLNGLLTHISMFPFLLVGIPFLINNVFKGQPTEYGVIEICAAAGTMSTVLLISFFKSSYGRNLLNILWLVAVSFGYYAFLFVSPVFEVIGQNAVVRIVYLGVGSFLVFLFYGVYASLFGAFLQWRFDQQTLGKAISLVIICNAFGRFIGFLLFGMLFSVGYQYAIGVFMFVSVLKILVHIPFIREENKESATC